MSGDELSKITSLFEPELITKGDYYIRSGEDCDKLSFVESGFLRLFARAGDKGNYAMDVF